MRKKKKEAGVAWVAQVNKGTKGLRKEGKRHVKPPLGKTDKAANRQGESEKSNGRKREKNKQTNGQMVCALPPKLGYPDTGV